MTNEEFLREALASPGCPEGFEQTYAYFCKYQKMTLDTLREFARVCEKNHVPYQLMFGSLLGAIRDGGQIPWDYDVDVVVPYYERERLFRALEQDLDGAYAFYAPGRVPHYRESFVRIVPRGLPHQMLHVDVFFVLGIPDEEPERTKYALAVRKLVYARRYTEQNLREYNYPFRSKVKQTALKGLNLLKYGKRARGDNSDFFSRYDVRETKDAIITTAGVAKTIYPSHIFCRSIRLETREGTFSAPADYEDFFAVKYGDWNRYFPVANRIAEVEKYCRRFRWYEEHPVSCLS